MIRKGTGIAAATAAFLSAISNAGWPGILLGVLLILAPIGILCWVLSTGSRTRRAVELIQALHPSFGSCGEMALRSRR